MGYVRVSTEDQNLGPEAQREQLAAYCEREGLVLVAICEDHGVSGGAEIDKRPALLEAFRALRDCGAGVLLAAKRDRIARDVMLAAMVERMAEREGARVQTADSVGNGDGPEAQLFRRMVDSFAEYERGIIRARTAAALAVKRRRGEKTGGALPYGKRLASDGVHLERDPREAPAVELARKLRAKGKPLRAIGAKLERKGYRPRSGGAWHPQTVSNMLRA